SHDADEVLELRRRDAVDPVRVLQRGNAASETEHEAPAGEALHRAREARGDHRMAGVVVRRRGLDADALAHRARRPRERRGFLLVVALGDERGAEAERLARTYLVDEIARAAGLPRKHVEPEFVMRHARSHRTMPPCTSSDSICARPPTVRPRSAT